MQINKFNSTAEDFASINTEGEEPESDSNERRQQIWCQLQETQQKIGLDPISLSHPAIRGRACLDGALPK